MARGAERREQLFESYRQSLAVVRPDVGDLVLCPVCMQHFDKQDAIRGAVTEEHLVPRALGGRLTTLLCQECNNTAGHQLHDELVEFRRFERFLKTGVMVDRRGSVTTKGKTIRSRINWAPGGIVLTNIPKANNPQANEAVLRELEDPDGHWAIDVSVDWRFRMETVVLAYLWCAYLAAFSFFGYRLVLTPGYELIRQSLRSRDFSKLPPFMAIQPVYLPDHEVKIHWVPVPDEGRCITVRLAGHGVMLPSPRPPGLDAIRYWWAEEGQREAAHGPIHTIELVYDPTAKQDVEPIMIVDRGRARVRSLLSFKRCSSGTAAVAGLLL